MRHADHDFSVIRFLRKERRLSLRAVAEKSGLSLGAVAKIESNEGNPVLRTLARLCGVLGITVSDLLALAERRKPLRGKGRPREIGKMQFSAYDLGERCLLFGRLKKGWRASAPSIHGNVLETCVLLSGKVQIKIHDTVYRMKPGELLQFDAVFDHEYFALEESFVLIVHGPRGDRRRS